MLYKDSPSNIYEELFKLDGFDLPIKQGPIKRADLDFKFLYENGEKELSPAIDSVQTAARIAFAKYYPKWKNISDLAMEDLAKGEKTTTTINQSSDDQTSAMDSPDLLTTGGQSVNGTTVTTTNTTQHVNVLLGLYQKYNLYDIIDVDLRRLLFDSVY